MLKFNFRQGGQFELKNVEIHEEGDLKGYVTGILQTSYSDMEHEFLYRMEDKINGGSYKLVSIDYGYKINLNEQHFEDIERIIVKFIMTRKSVREITGNEELFDAVKRTSFADPNIIQQQVMEQMNCDQYDADVIIENILNSNSTVQRAIKLAIEKEYELK